MPYKNCGVNACLIAISSIPRGQQLAPFPHLTDRIFHHTDMSAKCRETITTPLQAEYVVKVMERGPENFRERLMLFLMNANMIALGIMKFSNFPLFMMILLSTALVCNVLLFLWDTRRRICGIQNKRGWKIERQAILDVLANQETDFWEPFMMGPMPRLDASPYRETWTLEKQSQQMEKLKLQTRVIRAVYSNPLLKEKVQELLDTSTNKMYSGRSLGSIPAAGSAFLDRVFNPPRSRFKIWHDRLLNGFTWYINCHHFFGSDNSVGPNSIFAPEIDWILCSYVYATHCYRMFRYIWNRNGYGRRSTCCVCGLSTDKILERRKKTDNDAAALCPCCSGTAVCSIACEICQARLDKKCPVVPVPAAVPPPAAARERESSALASRPPFGLNLCFYPYLLHPLSNVLK